jgi:hypothetical protein
VKKRISTAIGKTRFQKKVKTYPRLIFKKIAQSPKSRAISSQKLDCQQLSNSEHVAQNFPNFSW